MIIIPANTISGGYEVANSLRFNSGSSDYLTRTPSSATNQDLWSLSFWIKRSNLGSYQSIYGVYANSTNQETLAFDDSDRLYWQLYQSSAVKGQLTTNRVFRDVSAFYNILIVYDSANGTAGNRMRMYINGVEETSFATDTNPSSGQDSQWNSTTAHTIGRINTTNYMNGYISELVAVDGTALSPTDVGEFDEDSGIWKPIDVSGLTFGTNGFYLDFEDSSALGNDAAGSNNFTVNNLTAIDSVSDVPTNNFATLNPLIYSSASKTYSEGNTAISTSDSGNWCATQNNIGVSSGKWYMEIKITNKAYLFAVGVGFNPLDSNGSNVTAFINSTYLVGEDTGTYGWRDNGALPQGGTSISTYTTNDILMIALDMDNLKVYFGKNGTWENSGDPTSGATGTGSMGNLTAGEDYFFIVTPRNGSASVNFGSPAFAISSGNTDGNSYGNFEYAVPSGYYALNTKNLAEYG